MTTPTDRHVLVCGPGSDDSTLIEALGALGWTPADPHATTPVDLLVTAPAPQNGDGTWSAAAAMEATGEVILGITEQRDRLRSGRGLVVVAVATPPGRAAIYCSPNSLPGGVYAVHNNPVITREAGTRCSGSGADKDFRHRSMRQPRRTTYPLVDLPPMRPG